MPNEVLEDPAIDAVFVVTRHRSHAAFVCRALEAGKAVFVEKPLALDEAQLDEVLRTVERTGNDRLMVGFNRRFAPLATELADHLRGRPGPLALRYLVNAGQLAPRSWYLDSAEGTRFTGEGGHFIDTVSALVGADPATVHSQVRGEDVHATLTYPDGSVGSIAYVTGGSSRFPKETLDVSGGGATARLDNFSRLTVWTRSRKAVRRALSPDKGQRHQVAAFLESVARAGEMPICLESLVATTRASLAAAGGADVRGSVSP